MGAGYAGYFGLWDVVEKIVPSWVHAASALAVGLSLSLFVSFEVYRMVAQTLLLRRCMSQALGDGRMATVNDLAEATQRKTLKLFNHWAYFIVPTVGFAAIGGGLLLGCLAMNVGGKLMTSVASVVPVAPASSAAPAAPAGSAPALAAPQQPASSVQLKREK